MAVLRSHASPSFSQALEHDDVNAHMLHALWARP
jgi:hypothetical protein